MRIAVYLPNLIGDATMATPALRALRGHFADAELWGIMRPSIVPVLEGLGWLDRTLVYRPGSADRRERFWGVVAEQRKGGVDLAVLLPNSFRSALMARLGGCRRTIGFARGGRGLLLTDGLAPTRDDSGRFKPVPAVESYLALAHHLGCPRGSTGLELATTAADEAAADEVWRRFGLVGGTVVALNTGGAFGPAKNWPMEYFARLATRIVRESCSRVLVLCGPAERDAARSIVALAGDPGVTSLADAPVSIGLSKACVRRSSVLVTTDSGPRHLATAFGVPTVTLFGPTHIEWTRTNHPGAIHLRVPVPCGPCQRPTCAEGHHRCMVELTPDSVFLVVKRLLGAEAPGPRPHFSLNEPHSTPGEPGRVSAAGGAARAEPRPPGADAAGLANVGLDTRSRPVEAAR